MICWCAIALADPASLLRALDTEDPHVLGDAVAAIERAPASADLADVLFAAGRACEDRLHDPVRALAIYERILKELPDAGVAIAAGRRAEKLRVLEGHASEAAQLSQLMADADALAVEEIVRRADALIAAPWPGAEQAALWIADWSCRMRRFADAQRRYGVLLERWPGGDAAQQGLRNAASCAIDARDWPLAEQLANRLPSANEIQRSVRSDLLQSIESARFRLWLYDAAWVVAVLAMIALIASLGEAVMRGGVRWPRMRPPIEVVFLAPLALVVLGLSTSTNAVIAPIVLRISLGGVVLTWVSGATLDLVRARGRAVRARAIGHAIVCALAVVAIGYISATREGLLEMLIETAKSGPGA